MRAGAVGAVVLYHTVGRPAGGFVGVDVFFVISGFLITGLLVRDAQAAGRVDLVTFYARRARRIIPAATFTILVTLVGAALLGQLRGVLSLVAEDARSAALFFSNIRFGNARHDYFTTPFPSLFRQYWSLSVEEQFYVLWPLIVAVGLGRRHDRRRLAVVLAAIVAASFVGCVVVTQHDAGWAFFMLPTRAWELGAGALVALTTPVWSRWSAATRSALGLVGAVLIVAACLFVRPAGFPGSIALVPVLGAVLLLAADGSGVTGRILSVRPVRLVGRYSYSLYLTHWAVLALAHLQKPTHELTAERALLVVAVFGVPLALVSYYLVEAPFRFGATFQRSRNALTTGAAGVAVASLLTLPFPAVASVAETTPRRAPDEPAGSLRATGFVPSNLTPTLSEAVRNRRRDPRDCRKNICDFGSKHASLTVVLFGDSHAAHLRSAVWDAAEAHDWRAVTMWKGGCPTFITSVQRRERVCAEFRRTAGDRISAVKPDLIIVSNFIENYSGDGEDLEPLLVSDLRVLRRIAPVLVLGETPVAPVNVAECLGRHLHDPSRCEPDRNDVRLKARNAMLRDASLRVGVRFADTFAWVCDATRCPTVVGHTLVYRDRHHFTTDFARSRSPLMSAAIQDALGRPTA